MVQWVFGLEPVEGPEVDGVAVDGVAVDGVLVDGVAVGTVVGLTPHEVVGMKVGVTKTESPSFVITVIANTKCVLFIRSTMTR